MQGHDIPLGAHAAARREDVDNANVDNTNSSSRCFGRYLDAPRGLTATLACVRTRTGVCSFSHFFFLVLFALLARHAYSSVCFNLIPPLFVCLLVPDTMVPGTRYIFIFRVLCIWFDTFFFFSLFFFFVRVSNMFFARRLRTAVGTTIGSRRGCRSGWRWVLAT